MASLSDMKILLTEENVLVGLISKLKDQLNRLKVEELALKSKIREENIKATTGVDTTTSNSAMGSAETQMEHGLANEALVDVNSTKLDLDVKTPSQYFYDIETPLSPQEEMEYDQDDEEADDAIEEERLKYNDYQDQLKYFMKDV